MEMGEQFQARRGLRKAPGGGDHFARLSHGEERH
jgi:hypothetical protein